MTATAYVAEIKRYQVSVGQITGRTVYLVLRGTRSDINQCIDIANDNNLSVECINPSEIIVSGFGRQAVR